MNELIYNVFFKKEYQFALTEKEVEFLIPLEKYDEVDKIIVDAEMNKFLFFNLLFNEIESNRVLAFLDFHFTNYHEDKEFLRILDLDVDEIFERFEIPWRENKMLSINPYGSILWSTAKVIITGIMPFFKPYDFAEYLSYKRRYKDVKYWIINKEKQLAEISTTFKEDLACTTNESIRRPVAFCIYLLYKSGELDISKMSKNEVKKFITDNFFNKETGKVSPSSQTVITTLFGYDLDNIKEKSFFDFNTKTKQWEFREDNFAYMAYTFPDDYIKGQEIASNLN